MSAVATLAVLASRWLLWLYRDAAADLAMAQTSDATRHFQAEPKPEKLPPEPFASIGANTFLKVKEWKARAD